MKLEFTKKFILDNRGCYSKEQVEKLSFINNKVITIEDIINSKIPYKDKIYFLWTSYSISYEERIVIYNTSLKIRRIFEKYYASHGAVGFHYSYYYYVGFTYGQVTTYEKNTILKEILKFIKEYRNNLRLKI